MKPAQSSALLALTLMLVFSSASGGRADTTIIYDDFSAPESDNGSHTPYNIFGTNINGLQTYDGSTTGTVSLGTNLPGSAWVQIGGGTSDAIEVGAPSSPGIGQPAALTLTGGTTDVSYASMRNTGGAALGLGSYDSGDLTVSIAVSPLSLYGETGGTYVGFVPNTTTYSSNFNGFELTSSGSLALVLNGAVQNDAVAFSSSTGSSFDDSTASLLTFQVDTATGAVVSLSLQGSDANYSSLLGGSDFTAAEDANFALASPSSEGGRYADLTITTDASVPEPSAAALLVPGIVALAFVVRRKLRLA